MSDVDLWTANQTQRATAQPLRAIVYDRGNVARTSGKGCRKEKRPIRKLLELCRCPGQVSLSNVGNVCGTCGYVWDVFGVGDLLNVYQEMWDILEYHV